MHRYLVVADLAVGARELMDFVRSRDDEPSRFHLVVPTHPDRRRLTWEETEARLVARRRLENGLAWMREIDPRADGEVGDVDPVLAIRERPHRRRTNVGARVRHAFGLPVVDLLGSPPALAGRTPSRPILRQTA